MKWFSLSLLCTFALIGCDALESTADKSAKVALSGSWYFEYKDPSERQIKNVVMLRETGTYAAQERITGETNAELSSGVWYVTEGLFKMQTNEIAGRKLGTLESLYFTCKLSDITSKEFSCEQGGSKHKLVFRRVQGDFLLS